ncbi:hypothetical protein AB0N09_05195 [Streptomyces erythrochromogenes]|uniref:hypothetical protein n=1 Tax=Streptomyces erythrochromogenes TaxID=285574 RepID=UPI0034261C20
MTTHLQRPATVTARIGETIDTLPATFPAFVERYPATGHAMKAVNATYKATPEQEQAAYEYAVSVVSNPAPDLTLADLYTVLGGQLPLF